MPTALTSTAIGRPVTGRPTLKGRAAMVRIHVWTPQRLTEEEERILEKMRGSPSFEPEPDREDRHRSFFSRVKDVFT
jgi:molecular chaperone DnaJ